MIGPTRVTWCAKINNVARFRQCSVMFPGNMASHDPRSWGIWCKPRDTMYLCRYFGLTAVLGRSIRILYNCVMEDDANLLHLFPDKTKQILTVSLEQHWQIMPRSCAMFPSAKLFSNVALGTSRYLYNDIWAFELCRNRWPWTTLNGENGVIGNQKVIWNGCNVRLMLVLLNYLFCSLAIKYNTTYK